MFFKTLLKEEKDKPWTRRKIFASLVSDKGLVSKTDEEFSKLNKKEKNVGQKFEQTRPQR